MLHGYFDLPTFHFFEEGNIWTGSLYTNFNYRITPKKHKPDDEEKSSLDVLVWYGMKCVNKAEEFAAEFSEDYSEAGLEKIIVKLTEEFEKFKNIRKN